jgi:hypothetical protein
MNRCLGAVLLLAVPAVVWADTVPLRVKETAGIRRFGYPVHAVVRLPRAVTPDENFQLLLHGKPVAAQFTRRGMDQVELDFAASPAPLAAADYVLEFGKDIPAPAETKTVTDAGDVLEVKQGLQFTVPKRLEGLLRTAKSGKNDYLRPDSKGLWRRGRVGQTHQVRSATEPTVIRSGPFATALQWQLAESPASTVTLDFPRSKSWIQMDWSVDDAKNEVAELGCELNLSLTGDQAFIDFGAGEYVYVALKRGETAELAADKDGWKTSTGPTDKKLTPYVVPPPGAKTGVEGWAHAMDRERCTAIGVTGFGTSPQARDVLSISTEGVLSIRREFAANAAAKKTLTVYLHFVPMPPHVGALTSPQSMLRPLVVEAGK